MSSKKQVETYLQRGRIALKEKATIRGVAEALVEPYHADAKRTEMVPFPPVPAPVVLTDSVKSALGRLKDVFAAVQPTERRTLTREEMIQVYDERMVLKEIVGLLSGRDEALKEIIRHHMDVDAEERGVAVPKAVTDPATGRVIVEATDRDASGHYILAAPQNPERCHIPGTNQDWSREFRQGTITIETNLLDDLMDKGEIERDVYLAMTRECRIFDDAKTMEAAANKPALRDGILTAIRVMTKVGKPGTSLYPRKAK